MFALILIQQPHHENVWANGVVGTPTWQYISLLCSVLCLPSQQNSFSLVSNPCTKSDRNYFSTCSTAALSRSLCLCLRSSIPNPPKHLNGTSKVALLCASNRGYSCSKPHLPTPPTSQWQCRADSRARYKRGQFSKERAFGGNFYVIMLRKINVWSLDCTPQPPTHTTPRFLLMSWTLW